MLVLGAGATASDSTAADELSFDCTCAGIVDALETTDATGTVDSVVLVGLDTVVAGVHDGVAAVGTFTDL